MLRHCSQKTKNQYNIRMAFQGKETYMKYPRVLIFIFILDLILAACSPRPTPTLQVPPTEVSTIQVPTETPKSQDVPATSTPEIATDAEMATPTSSATPELASKESVWVINQVDRTILRIDPAASKIRQKITVDGNPIDLAVAPDYVWIIEAISNENSNILKLDPKMDEVIRSIPVRTGEAVSIAVDNDYVWVGTAEGYETSIGLSGEEEYARSGSILKIDPLQNAIIDNFHTDAVVSKMIPEDNILWALETKNEYSYFNRINLDTRRMQPIPASIQTAEFIPQFRDAILVDGSFWTIPMDRSSQNIFRVDPHSGDVESIIKMGVGPRDTPTGIVQAENSIWVPLFNGRLNEVDPQSEQIIKTIYIGDYQPSSIFYAFGFIWVESIAQSMLIQVDPTTYKVVSSLSTGSIPPPTATPTITVTVDPSIYEGSCPDITTTPFQIGMRARLSDDNAIPNRVRAEPTNQSPILWYLEPGVIVDILAGPACVDTWVWWNVMNEDTGETGWTAEGNGTQYWLVPLPSFQKP
jgi:hypothetical protein